VKRCPNPMPGDSEIEIRQVFEPDEVDPSGAMRERRERAGLVQK
jgi:hypothetical protein